MNLCFIGSMHFCVVFGGEWVWGCLVMPTIDMQSELFPEKIRRPGGKKQVLYL